MIATFNPDFKPVFTDSFLRDKGFHSEHCLLVPNEYDPTDAKSVVTLRFFKPGSQTVYAYFWASVVIDGVRRSVCSTARFTGGNQDKYSGAAAKAIINAGITLDEDISGRGKSAIKEAFKAIGKAIGHENTLYYTSYE